MRTSQDRLTEEQILELLTKYREKRDERSRDRLVSQYSNLVESIARRFVGAGEPAEDLAQEGYIGLISAVEGFDTKKGVKFSTYATHFVIGQIKHYLRDKGKIIKEPAWLQELNQRMTREIEKLAQELGRQPTEGEIAKVMKIPEEEVREMLNTREVFKVSSLDGPEDGSTGAGDADKAKKQKWESPELPVEEKLVLNGTLQRLKDIEQQVIHEYYFRGLNQTEIARRLGISCNYVSHILRNSTKKLRKILTTEDIREAQIQMQSMHRRGSVQTQLMEITDIGTQLYSRGFFLARLEEELLRASRGQYEVAVMLITLEYMSDVHQDWTPLTAEERLFVIGQNIRKRVRKADMVARYSDNQFALILPHTGTMASKVCERIQEIVSDLNGENHKGMLSLRATVNFAAFPAQAGTFADLLEKVQALDVLTEQVEEPKAA